MCAFVDSTRHDDRWWAAEVVIHICSLAYQHFIIYMLIACVIYSFLRSLYNLSDDIRFSLRIF